MTEENIGKAMADSGISVGKQLLAALVDEIRQQTKPWSELTQFEQNQVIYRLKNRVRNEVVEAVNIIAAAERPVLQATVEQVVFKGGIKATLVMNAGDPAAHDLADAAGHRVLIVITKPDEDTEGMDDIEGEKDQGDFIEDEQSNVEAAIQKAWDEEDKNEAVVESGSLKS